ncbi:MAG: biotin--[acetyl-CoA-carboxylase] ligase [Microbacterium sp.]
MSWEKARRVAAEVTEIDRTGSTNADLVRRLAEEDLPHLTVLLTRDQRSGRGRLDRVWTAPAGSALAVSVAVRIGDVPPEARGWIPLAAGVALSRAIRAQLPGREVGVKWPNDVLIAGRKVSGILAEASARPGAVVIGSGINTRMTADELPVATATSLRVEGAEDDEDGLVAAYLDGLRTLISDLEGGDRAGVRRAVADACVTLGRRVRVSLPDGSDLLGTAADIDEEGRLVVRSDGRDVAVAAGDVVHVRPAE